MNQFRCISTVFLLLAFTAPVAPYPQSDREAVVTEIRVEYSRCYGPCPVFEAILRIEGNSSYIGKENVSRLGRHVGSISKERFERLADLLTLNGFWNMKESYSNRPAVRDLPTLKITALRGGKRKMVVWRQSLGDSDGAIQEAIKKIEDAIREEVERISWRPERTAKLAAASG